MRSGQTEGGRELLRGTKGGAGVRGRASNGSIVLVPVPMGLWGLLAVAWLVALHPPFLARGAVYFREQFLDGGKWQARWVPSHHRSDYGTFRLATGKLYSDRDLDKGLQTSEDLKFYAISSRFKPFSNEGRPLVIQYTVKHKQRIDCGGGYVKIFPSSLDQKNMSGESPYYVMFGPDICSSDTKKVHAILNYKNKFHPIKKPIRCIVDGFTHLYTLVLNPDHTYKVKIDNRVVASGFLEEDWDLLPPRTIDDPAVEKPEDWEEEEEVDDPEDQKPEDWDIPEFLVDTSAEKPKGWEEAKEGDWQPPLLPNPLYRGEWRPRKIPNPKYKGAWPHPQIANPEYEPDVNLSVYRDIGVLGLDLWQVRSGTIFDNFLITDDEDYAEDFGEETWRETQEAEQKMNQQQIEEEKRRKQRMAKKKERPQKKKLLGSAVQKEEL
uniref:Calreticulin n=1 Tax=Pogona vitticeps TaxID=103695 RepID=A0ABM5ELJ1_9SAUR